MHTAYTNMKRSMSPVCHRKIWGKDTHGYSEASLLSGVWLMVNLLCFSSQCFAFRRFSLFLTVSNISTVDLYVFADYVHRPGKPS